MVVFLTGGKQLNYLAENKIKTPCILKTVCLCPNIQKHVLCVKYLAKIDTKLNF